MINKLIHHINVFRSKLFIWMGNVKKLPVNGFKWENDLLRFNEDFIKNYNEDVEYFLEVDVEYPKQLWSSHKDLSFLPEGRKLEKVEKLVCNIEDKEKYVIHIRALKQGLNNGLILKDVHRVIKFNQEAWLKPYIDMNTKLRKEAKNEFEKDFSSQTKVNQSTKRKQNYSTQILITLLSIFLLKTFLRILIMMLKDGLIHLTMIRMIKDHFK